MPSYEIVDADERSCLTCQCNRGFSGCMSWAAIDHYGTTDEKGRPKDLFEGGRLLIPPNGPDRGAECPGYLKNPSPDELYESELREARSTGEMLLKTRTGHPLFLFG